MPESRDRSYRIEAGDALQGGLVIVADAEAGLAALRAVAGPFAEAGYAVTVCAPDEDLSALVATLPAPRFALGIGRGAEMVLALPAGAVTAASAFYPDAVSAAPPVMPTILHFGREARLQDADVAALMAEAPDLPVFVYPGAGGFFTPDSPAYEDGSAGLARLRTLALFRRTLSRGEN